MPGPGLRRELTPRGKKWYSKEQPAVRGGDTDTIGVVGGVVCLVQLIPLLGTVASTEWALQRYFDESGGRR